MRLDRLTKILINLALIALAALLLKSLMTNPKNAYAQLMTEYKVSSIEEEFEALLKEEKGGKLGMDWWDKLAPSDKLTYMLNWNFRRGWRFHDFLAVDEELFLIFERQYRIR